MGIRGLFGYAARTGLIATNFCDLLVRRERPKPGKAKERYLTAEEMGALLQHVSGEGSAVVPLLLFSGLRASEALGLAWGDIDFAQQLIRVRYLRRREHADAARQGLDAAFGPMLRSMEQDGEVK